VLLLLLLLLLLVVVLLLPATSSIPCGAFNPHLSYVNTSATGLDKQTTRLHPRPLTAFFPTAFSDCRWSSSLQKNLTRKCGSQQLRH
jgi:hypothetical protein